MSIRLVRDVYLADNACVLGELELARNVSIWYGASVRGDVAKVILGENTNVQDNAVVHCDSGFANRIGANVTIGHGALVHGESIGDWSLVGMGAIILGHTRIGSHCIIAAGAVVPPATVVPDGMLVLGVPGKIARPINEKERQYLDWLAPHYINLAKLHYESPNNPRVAPWGA
jgi:carbonic anhydrase/acetyltransferase-like protein (isoleucine patch superfamily)